MAGQTGQRTETVADARSSVAHDFSAHLELLAEMGQDFAASLDIGETLERALQRIAAYLDAEAASLFLLEADDRELVCRACFGPTNITGLRIGPDQGIVGRSIQENHCQIVRDVRLDPDFSKVVDEDTGFQTRSILCAPLSVKDRRGRRDRAAQQARRRRVVLRRRAPGLAGARELRRARDHQRPADRGGHRAGESAPRARAGSRDPTKPLAPAGAARLSGVRPERAGPAGLGRLLRRVSAAGRAHRLQPRRRLGQGRMRRC